MDTCYIGRGSLLGSEIGSSRGFFTLSGESELTLTFEEANEAVEDARHGVIERVDWYARTRRATLEAECFRVEEQALTMLLKGDLSSSANAPAGNEIKVITSAIETGNYFYLGRPGGSVSLVSFVQANALPVPSTHYKYNGTYGTIQIIDKTGLVFPLTATVAWQATAIQTIATRNDVEIKALFIGFNKTTGKEVFAEFYRLKLDIASTLALISRGFSGIPIKMQAVQDFSIPPANSPFGYYGRILQK